MILFRLPLVLVLSLLAGCGFHLRGQESATLPAALSRLHVTMSGRLAYPPLLVEVRDALFAQGIDLEPAGPGVARLSLFDERFAVEPILFDPRARAIRYLMGYRVSFNLKDAAGRDLIARETVRLQREYSFDPTSPIAAEREADFLQAEMRRDVVRQILRRLAALDPEAGSP